MKQENKRNDYPKQIKTHFAFAFFNVLLVKQAELVCMVQTAQTKATLLTGAVLSAPHYKKGKICISCRHFVFTIIFRLVKQ